MNPFKLVGSYIGLILGIIIAIFFFLPVVALLCEFGGECKPPAYLLPLIPILIGFFLGYIIHFLIRRLVR